jgi:hypothetical protein
VIDEPRPHSGIGLPSTIKRSRMKVPYLMPNLKRCEAALGYQSTVVSFEPPSCTGKPRINRDCPIL